MDAYIITGASKGIGLALSKQLAEAGHAVIGIARTVPAHWPGTRLLPYDLSDTGGIPSLMKQVMTHIPKECRSFTLINNAGTIEPIGFARDNDPEKISASIGLNLTAPMILSTTFLKELQERTAAKQILNISSGAGRKAYKGWSAYCAGKAGLDHFSRCLDEENTDVKVISIAPGIIDTGMQGKIRESTQEQFPMIENFRDYKEKGLLSSPDETAKKLISLMSRKDFHSQDPIMDIRNL